jgi:hypothetical protein
MNQKPVFKGEELRGYVKRFSQKTAIFYRDLVINSND